MDDVRIGRSLRLLRQRRGLTQLELAERAGVSQQFVSLVERGHLDLVAIRSLRRLFAAVDARFECDVSWRGGQLDRLLDANHAALVGRSVELLEALGWSSAVEVSYSVYGERGSIDVLGALASRRAAVVIEVKTELFSFEALARKTDEKVRLARSRLCAERFDFVPAVVARILVLPDLNRVRRSVSVNEVILDTLFPARTGSVRGWLRDPGGPMSGILFLADRAPAGSSTNGSSATRDRRGAQRVRRARAAPGRGPVTTGIGNPA